MCAAGLAWTAVTGEAPWAARYLLTSVIDAAGNIFVLGGGDDSNYFNDVWQSTNQGVALRAVRHVCVLACVRACVLHVRSRAC